MTWRVPNGCRIVTFERKTYNIVEPAREFAIHEARFDWVLVVDADEIVTPELKQYLYQRIKENGCPDGLYIPRKNYFMGRFMRCHYPDHILRFFRKDKTHWPPIIHCTPVVDGRVEKIPAKNKELAFEHLANDTVADIVRKANIYSENEVPRRRKKNYGVLALLCRPFYRCFKSYILKQGFHSCHAGGLLSVCGSSQIVGGTPTGEMKVSSPVQSYVISYVAMCLYAHVPYSDVTNCAPKHLLSDGE